MGIFSKKKEAVSESGTEVQTVAETPEAASGAADSELIAVISAAIAAYEGEQFRQTLYIRKLKRVCGVRPIWGYMGTQEAIDSRRM